MKRTASAKIALGLALVGAALTGCGSRLGHQQFVAAGGGTISQDSSSGGGSSGEVLGSGSSAATGGVTTGSNGTTTSTVNGKRVTTPVTGASSSAGTGAGGSQPNLATGVTGTNTGTPVTGTDGTGTNATGPGSTGAQVTTPGGAQPTGAGTATTGTTSPNGATPTKGTTGATKPGTKSGSNGTKTGTNGGGTAAPSSGTSGGGTTDASPGAASGPVQTGDIIIGSVGDYSGVAGAAEAQGPVGLQVWAQNLNDNGGINGRNVKVIVEDDGSDGGKAVSEIDDLVTNQHVVAFAGQVATFTIAAQRPYLEQHQIPVIGGDCSTPDWNSSPMLFSECPSADTEFFLGGKIAKQYGVGPKLGVLYCQEASVCTAANNADSDSGMGYAKANGLQVVYDKSYSLTQPDFTQECLGMQQAGAQMVSVVGDPNVLSRVASSCTRQGFNPQYLSGSALINPNMPSNPAFSNLVGGVPTLPFDGLNTPAETAFRNAFATYAPDQAAGPGGSLGWVSGLLLEKALRIAAAQPGGVISSATIIAAMGTIKNETLGGASVPLTFTPGQGSADFKCEFVMAIKDGKWNDPNGDTPICRS